MKDDQVDNYQSNCSLTNLFLILKKKLLTRL